jgi:hypothetical protein
LTRILPLTQIFHGDGWGVGFRVVWGGGACWRRRGDPKRAAGGRVGCGVGGSVGFGVLVGELNYGWGKLDGVAACSGDV